MAELRIKNSDDVQVLVDFLKDSGKYCSSSIVFFEKLQGLNIKEMNVELFKDNIYVDDLPGWFSQWLLLHYLVLPLSSRLIFIDCMAEHHGTVNLMKIFRANRDILTKREFILYKKLLEGKLPNIEREGEFDV